MSSVIVGLGEVLWDMLPDGKQLGGAPANFVYHAKALGQKSVESYIVSAIGDDSLGVELQSCLDRLGINHKYLHVNKDVKTGVVSVTIDKLGIPDYIIEENVGWDFIPQVNNNFQATVDVACFGTLAQRSDTSKKNIIDFVTTLPANALKIFDINLRQSFFNCEIIETSLKLANILKINDDELVIVSKLLQIFGNEDELLEIISQRYDLKLSILTKGDSGSFLYSEGKYSKHPGFKVKCIDSVGAGDAFTAATAIGLLKGFDLDKINDCSNQVASYVCTQSGATPDLPINLVNLFH